ncbi:MAG: bacteriohemerythrin [Lachnospiraceae bacterium]
MKIEFDDNLITGNHMIDDQHRELIDRIAQFVESCEEGNAKVKSIKMLDFLLEYTDYHFAEEEKLQAEVSYPEIAHHKEKHKEFKNTLQDLNILLLESEGPTEEFVQQVEKDVVDWLFHHIKTFDRSVAEYIFLIDNPERL